jgi:hypothetical protein
MRKEEDRELRVSGNMMAEEEVGLLTEGERDAHKPRNVDITQKLEKAGK